MAQFVIGKSMCYYYCFKKASLKSFNQLKASLKCTKAASDRIFTKVNELTSVNAKVKPNINCSLGLNAKVLS